MDFLDRLIWNLESFISAMAHSVMNMDPTAIKWFIATTEPDGWILIAAGLLALLLAFSALVYTLAAAVTLGRMTWGAYGGKGIAIYAALWIVASPLMLVASAVLAVILARMPASVHLLGLSGAAAYERFALEHKQQQERAKHAAHIAPGTEPDLAKIDEWRRQQPDLPTRPEAIRRLVKMALKVALKGKADA